jgi:hypothetical protein
MHNNRDYDSNKCDKNDQKNDQKESGRECTTFTQSKEILFNNSKVFSVHQ